MYIQTLPEFSIRAIRTSHLSMLHQNPRRCSTCFLLLSAMVCSHMYGRECNEPPGHPTKHTISSDPEAAGELLGSTELEARRPDGFKFIIAPLLRGEGNWPSVSLYASLEQRIHFTMDALLARIPFWLKVPLCTLLTQPMCSPVICKPLNYSPIIYKSLS